MISLAKRKGSKTEGGFRLATKTAARIAVRYAIFAAAWIIGSDLAVRNFLGGDPGDFILNISKGLLFVAVSATLLWLMCRSLLTNRAQAVLERLELAAELHSAMTAARAAGWSYEPDASSRDLLAGHLHLSDELRSMLGHDRNSLPDSISAWAALIAEDDRASFITEAQACLDGTKPHYDGVYRFQHRNGSQCWIHITGHLEPGERPRWKGLVVDVSERQRLLERSAELQTIFNSAREGLAFISADRRVTLSNARFVEMLDLAQEPTGQGAEPLLFSGHDAEEIDVIWSEAITGGYWSGKIDIPSRAADIRRAIRVRLSSIRGANDGDLRFLVRLTEDDDLETARARIDFLRRYDPLTRLANRDSFVEKLDAGMQHARATDSGLAVVVLDIDRFQAISSALGQRAADQVLIAVARKLNEIAPTCARFYADEFALLIGDVGDEASLIAYLEDLQVAFTNKLGVETPITVTMGAARFPRDAEEPEGLIRAAKNALYDAQCHRGGRVHYRLCHPELLEKASEYVRIAAALRDALPGDSLQCHLQPKVDLRDGRWIGAEALLRWKLDGQPISPQVIIEIAEQHGLADRLGLATMRQVTQKLAAWRAAGLVPDDFRIAVNLSQTQLDDQLLATLRTVLADSGLPGHCLRLEITETILMHDSHKIASLLRRCREELNIDFAIDDFGVGYSSLSELRQLPVAELKIDRSFVNGLPHEPGASAIAQSVISLGFAFGLDVVAEGLENNAHRSSLIALGCKTGQGFLFSRALDFADFETHLRKGVAHRKGGPSET